MAAVMERELPAAGIVGIGEQGGGVLPTAACRRRIDRGRAKAALPFRVTLCVFAAPTPPQLAFRPGFAALTDRPDAVRRIALLWSTVKSISEIRARGHDTNAEARICQMVVRSALSGGCSR